MAFFNDNFLDIFPILPHAFGLDVSDSGFKFVYIQKNDEYRVKIFGEHSFASGIVQRGKVLKPEELAKEVSGAIARDRKHNGLPPYVVLGFPEEDVFIRVVQLPKMPEKDLAQAIRWEIEGNIPLSIDNVYYAYQPILQARQKLDHMDVLVAAAPRDIVDGYIQTCMLAGLRLLAVEPASVALARSLVPLKGEFEDIVLLDLGAMHSRIAIYGQGALRLTSSVPVRLEDGISNIMRTFSCSHEEAERLLYEHGLSRSVKNGELFAAVIPTFTDLKEQIEKYINFQKTHREHEHGMKEAGATSVILAGGGALVPGAVEYFSTMLNASVELANPWVNLPTIHKGELPHIPYRDALRFASSIGLGLRGALPPISLEENNFFAP